MNISPEPLATLQMLRRQYRPAEIPAAPTKRPVGGRPNPIAGHRYQKPKPRAAERAARRRALRNLPPRHVPHGTIVDTFVRLVLDGIIPVDEEITGPQLNALIAGHANPKTWETLAVALREADAPVRLLCLKQRSRYVIEHR